MAPDDCEPETPLHVFPLPVTVQDDTPVVDQDTVTDSPIDGLEFERFREYDGE